MIICISGQSGSGKTTAAYAIAEALGLPVLHLDQVGELVWQRENVKEDLVARFGKEILDSTGKIDIKKLGDIIFAAGAESDRAFHNNVVMPEVIKVTDSKIAQNGGNMILDFKLLPIMKYWDTAHFRIHIESDVEARLARMEACDKTDRTYLLNRDAAAPAITLKPPRVDYLIVNNGTEQEFRELIDIGIAKIKARLNG